MRVDGDVRLNLSIHIFGAGDRLASVRTTGVGAWAGDKDKRSGVGHGSTDRGHNSQDNQQYSRECYHSDRLQKTHRNPPDVKITNSSLKEKSDPLHSMEGLQRIVKRWKTSTRHYLHRLIDNITIEDETPEAMS